MTKTPSFPQVQLHGVPSMILGDGSRVALERKHAALLAYLHLAGPTPRTRLAGLLWPEVTEARARGNLRQRLSKLSQQRDDLVQEHAGVLAIAEGVRFDAAPAADALLAAHSYDDCEAFARWLEGQRDSARERKKREWLAEVREAAHSMRLDDALFAADQLLQTDRESEEAYRVLMEVFYLRGDHAAALSAWDRCRHMLRELYGVAPSAATSQLGKSILQAADDQRAAVAPVGMLPVSVLRPPRLIGRADAMAALAAAWQAGDAVLITGDAGQGKSRLVADFAAVAGEFATASGRPGDAVVPYSTLSRLVLSALDRFAPALEAADAAWAARLMPRLASALGQPSADPLDPTAGLRNEHDRSRGLLALARILASCPSKGCAGFVVDDLQFADPASIEALRFVAEPPPLGPAPASGRGPALRFILAARPDEIGAEATELVASLEATGRMHRIVLEPLREAETLELVASLQLAGVEAASLAARIWRQVGGNPAFVLESLKLLLSTGNEGASQGSGALPARIEAVIARRLEMLTPRARHLAQLAAIAGADFSVGLAGSALACPVIELVEPMRELQVRQIFYGRQFVHDVIGSVVLQSVPSAVAEFMHRFVAEQLVPLGAEPAAIAAHWRACGEWRAAGEGFLEASERARASARFREQGELIDAAIECFEHEPAARDALFAALLRRTEAAEARDAPGVRGAEVERLVALARSPMQKLQALATEIGWHTDAARTDVSLAAVQSGIEQAVALEQPRLALQLAQTLSWQLAMRGRLDDAIGVLSEREPWVTQDADTQTRAVFHRTRAAVYMFCDHLQDAIEEGRRALGALRELQDWSAMLPAMSNLGLSHHWRGEFEQARTVLEEARALRERVQGRGSALMIDVHLAGVRRDLGDIEGALELLEPVRAILRTVAADLDSRTERVIVDNHLAEVWLARGRLQQAAEYLAEDDDGIGVRFRARRLTLKLRVARAAGEPTDGLRRELLGLLPRIDSAFMRVLVELELAKLMPAESAADEYIRLHDHPVSAQRPGLRLHAALCAAVAYRQLGRAREAERWSDRAHALSASAHAFDLPGAAAAMVDGT